MALINFVNNSEPYLNAENLNNNFNECFNIIETGTNNNGNYVKFSDGTMICSAFLDKTRFLNSSNTYSTAQNINIYRSNSPQITFPQQFIDNNIILNITPSTSTNGTRISWSRYYNITKSNVEIQLLGLEPYIENGVAYTNLLGVSYIAIGKWK